MELSYLFKLFAGLVAVLNPVGAVPMFMTLTESRTPEEKAVAARTTAMTVACVLMISAFAGQEILRFFGISIASFRVGGGILILFMAIAMLHAKRTGTKQTREESVDALSRHEVAVVPLGIPLLAGPGAISTVIVYRHEAEGWVEYLTVCGVILCVALLVFMVLRFATPFVAKLGKTGLNVIVRVMGLVLASIAVEFITKGLMTIFPILGTGVLPHH